MVRRFSLVCTVVVLCGLWGCDRQLSPQATEQLQSGKAAYAAGNNEEAIVRMDAFLQQNAKSSRADEAFYIRGLARYSLKQYPPAKSDLQAALDSADSRELRAKAALALGDLGYDTNDMPSAEAMYASALNNLDRGVPPADHACYRLGQSLQRQGKWEQADLQFSRVLHFAPGSELAKRAAKLIHCRAWTVRAGSFAGRGNAESSAAELRKEKLPVEIKVDMSNGAAQYLLNVGRYSSCEQALAALAGVKRIQSDAYVTATE